MKSKVYWEWELSTLDEHGDIVDLDHCLEKDVGKLYAIMQPGQKMSLLRVSGNQNDGELSRSYAEVNNCLLDAETDDGHKVPARFHALLAE